MPLFGYDGIFSFFSLTEQKPAKLKAELEKILTSEKTSEKDFMRLSFLYFFELMGVPHNNEQGFQVLFNDLIFNKQGKNVGKEKDLTKDQLATLQFDVRKQTFCYNTPTLSKEQAVRLRNFKRFVKLLVTTLVDQFPEKQKYLMTLLTEIVNLSRIKMRLIRFSATHIAMTFFKALLHQSSQLSGLRE